MIIETTAWHYRVYAYWMRRASTYRPAYKENLCHYVPVLLFWAPLLWTRRLARLEGKRLGFWLNLVVFGGSVALLLVMKGWLFVAILLSSFVGGTLLAAALLAVAVALFGDRKPPKIPSTVKLAVAYAVAHKRRICPFITFEGGDA